MTTPHEIEEGAKAIYDANKKCTCPKQDLPEWENLPPHLQVYYIRRVELLETSAPVEAAS